MPLAQLKAEIPGTAADGAEEALLQLGDPRWSLLEDAVARRAWIIGVFRDAREARAQWARLEPLLPCRPGTAPALRRLASRDWAESYKDHFKAWRFGPLHWVPVWLRRGFRAPKGARVVWLDPGMAFGTGNHETTRLCCRRLVELARSPRGGRLVDAGCGSGILALSAARLGFGPVVGFDIDPEAIRVSRRNAVRNRLAGRVRFVAAGLRDGLRGPKADIVLANIQADVLMRGARELIRAVAPGGTLVLSGILATERDRVRSVFQAAAPHARITSRRLGQWSDLSCRMLKAET